MSAGSGTREAVLAASAGRDRVIDTVKAAALVLVVVGHNCAWTTLPDGGFGATLNSAPWLFWATWVFEIIPLFFVMAGTSLSGVVGREGSVTYKRMSRLMAPALPLLLATLILATVVPRVMSPDLAVPAGILPVQPLWFLGVYLLVLACAPLIVRITSPWQFAVWLGLIGLVDYLRIAVWQPAGWVNLVLVWSLFAAIGANLRRLRQLAAWKLALGFVLSAAAAVTLVRIGPYSAALISTDAVPGVTNLAPPTTVLAFAGIAQACLLLLAWSPIERLLAHDRVWVPVAVFASRSMELYVWHVLVMGLLIVGVLTLDLAPPALSLAWWGLHLAVLAIDVGVILALAPSLRRASAATLRALAQLVPRALAARLGRGPRAGAAALAMVVGIATLLVSEGGLHDAFTVRTVTVLPYLPIIAIVVIAAGTALAERARSAGAADP